MERNCSVSGNLPAMAARTQAPPVKRRTSGGPVLQQEVTEAISGAFFEELADVGYGRLSIDAVAKRAGVGKAAVYRRWGSKLELTLELVGQAAVAAIDVPDTGTLRGDIEQYLRNADAALQHRLASKIIPDMLAETVRNPELADALRETIRDPRRSKANQILERAVERGELPADIDYELCLDFLGGPLYWRRTVIQIPTGTDYFSRMADKIRAAMKA
jgi:AcrR family transcriptional regulator